MFIKSNTPIKATGMSKSPYDMLTRLAFVKGSISNGVTILGPADTTVFAQESYAGQGLR